MSSDNTHAIIKTTAAISVDITLRHTLIELCNSLVKQHIVQYLAISVALIDEDDCNYAYGTQCVIEAKSYDGFIIETEVGALLEIEYDLISSFIANRVALEKEREKVSVFRECDEIFDESILSAYSREDAVLNYLKKKFHLHLSHHHFHGDIDLHAGSDEYSVVDTLLKSNEKTVSLFLSDEYYYSIKMEFNENAKAGYLLFSRLKPFSPFLQELLLLSSEVFDTNVAQSQKAAMYASRFKKYVGNSEVLDILIKDPSLLDIKKCDIVIMSVDLVDSTKFASQCADPIDLFNNINSYLDFIAKIVTLDYRGTLDKYIGDEVMALFGAPLEDPNFVETSLKCAETILEKIAVFNRNRAKMHKPCFNVKISLGYAEDVVVGEVGSDDTQIDYTAIGDDVNRLFRMAAHGIESNVIVNEKLTKHVSLHNFTLVQSAMYKGIEEVENIYKVDFP